MTEETQRRWQARRALWQDAFDGIDLAGKRVLDAGTGEGHFTRFLLERKPSKLVSVTCDAAHAEFAKRTLTPEAAVPFEVLVADLTQMPQIPDDSFDVIGADFLIAAVSAYTPYREIDCLRELHRTLAPGGRIVLTGWEIWPEVRNQTEARLRQLFKLREACRHLAGADPFREHPKQWLVDRLADLGAPAEKVCTRPEILHGVDWLLENARHAIQHVPQEYLRQALQIRFDEIANPLRTDPAFSVGLEFGRLYAVVSCKLHGGLLLGR